MLLQRTCVASFFVSICCNCQGQHSSRRIAVGSTGNLDEVSLLQSTLHIGAEAERTRTTMGGNPSMLDWPALQRRSDDPRVVITLSTVPGGVVGLGPTLRSLRNQTFHADAIELNLPRTSNRGLGAYPDLPPEETEGIDVYRTEDWLALTNVIPTVQRARNLSGDVLLIVVDDDKVYPHSLVEDHVRAYRHHPRSASACRGYLMPPGGDISTSVFFPAWDELFHSAYGYNRSADKQVAVITGSDSWSAPVTAFSEGLWTDLNLSVATSALYTENLATDAALMNDIWVSGQLSRQKVQKFVIPCRTRSQGSPSQFVPQRQDQNIPPRRQDRNQAVMKFFLRDWASSEIMPMEEVQRYPWLVEKPRRAPPKPRSVFSWFKRTFTRGLSTVFLGL